MPEGEEEDQEIENLFEKIMKECFLFGEGNRHTSPGSTESPKQDGPKEDHTKIIIIKMPQVKDKERILKAAI